MSEIFVEPEEIKAIEEVVEPQKTKEKKKRQSHLTEERKAELKIIRVEALKKGREAKKLKRELEAKAKADNQETKKEETKPLLPIKEIVDEPPVKEKAEKKPRSYKSVNNSEVELLKKDKKIKELEHENETRTIKQEIISWKNENRLLKEQLEKLKKEQPVKEETKVVVREKKVEVKEKPKPNIVLPLKEKKKFHSRRVFGF